MKVKLSMQKIAGIFSTAMLITASVMPDTLHIPIPARPWVFLVTIAWIMLEVSGVFVS
jgi:hypothetical protein